MISSFDLQNLESLLKDFYTVVGIRISIFDDEYKLVTEYPKEAPRFCQNIRKSEEGRDACAQCDAEACQRARKLRQSHIYVCHAGITEAITPIQMEGGILGYAILAHMLPEEEYDQALAKAAILAQKYGVSEKESRASVNGISVKNTEQIHAAVRILESIASYVYTKHYVHWKKEDISMEIEKYIQNHLSESFSSDDLCNQFQCSRAYLYKVSMNSFGMGIMQYVNYCRIEKAKKLLKSGNSIQEASDECGFSEYNYFCKVFKRTTGLSPSEYKNKKRKQ